MTDTIKAELVYYRIDVSRPEGRKAYAELCETLKEIPFETWVSQGSFANGTTNFELQKFINSLRKELNIEISSADYQLHSREIHLETKHLFEDQWSTAEGFRLHNKTLFDWPALHIKEGYYIRQNPQLKVTFEQGWSARPFKEQFPELSDFEAQRLDKVNEGIYRLYFDDMLTDDQLYKIRDEKFPRLVSEAVSQTRNKKGIEQ